MILHILVTYHIKYNIEIWSSLKNNGGYNAGLQLQLEIYKDDAIIKHESSTADIEIFDYDKTESTDLFLFGYAKFKLDTGKYSIKPIFKINNTQREGCS